MLAVARFRGMAQARGLILAGSAASIAAAFNTPFAAVILSGLAALALSGSYHYFGSTSVAPVSTRDWGLVLACGIGGGALGAAFSGMALHFGRRIRRWAQSEPMKRMVLLALFCGLAIAAIRVLSGGKTFGTGYEQARSAVQDEALPIFSSLRNSRPVSYPCFRAYRAAFSPPRFQLEQVSAAPWARASHLHPSSAWRAISPALCRRR